MKLHLRFGIFIRSSTSQLCNQFKDYCLEENVELQETRAETKETVKAWVKEEETTKGNEQT